MKKAIIIGAGIVGLAMARALAVRGYQVKVFERGIKAVGASIRNFGMVWPIGQPQGELLERAMLSILFGNKYVQKQYLAQRNGFLLIANHVDEMQVIEEFYDTKLS